MAYPGRVLNTRQPVELLARTEKSNENLDPDAVSNLRQASYFLRI